MAGQPPNEEGEGMHQENYLDQILRSLKSEQEEITASPSTHASASMSAAGSYATRMPGSTSNVQAPDLGGSVSGSALNTWPFISSSSRHPGLPSLTKQEPGKRDAGGQESELYRDVDTPGSSSFLPRDLLMPEFPPWFLEEEVEQRNVVCSQIGATGPSYSSRFPDRLEDEFVGRQLDFDVQLGFRTSPSGLEAGAQAAARRGTSTVPSSEALYGAPAQGRMWPPPSFESISSMQQTPIPAAAPRGPRGDVEPPGVAIGRSTNPETPTSSFSSGSPSEADDDAERRSTSRGRHRTAASPAEEGVSSAKRKTPEPSLDEGEETSTKSGSESKRPQHTLNRPRKKGGAKRVREPRYAIKTRTDVDIMDDGFKWRKYGQKAVKNSPHPRNYYRCTTPNCPVRKRVERSCEDSGLVITTYEGMHTHQTPGFHRSPSLGFFGERPVGLGGGLFAPPQSGLQGPGYPGSSSHIPGLPNFPSSSANLASLQQSIAARGGIPAGLAGLGSAGQQLAEPSNLAAGGSSFQEGFAHRLLGLQDTFVVKHEPLQFTAVGSQDFLSRPSSSSSGLPLIPRHMPQAAQGMRSDTSSAMMQLTARQRQMQGSGSASGSSAQAGPQAGPYSGLIQQPQRQMITGPSGQQLQESSTSLISRARAASPGQETIRGDRNPISSNTLISLQAVAAVASHHQQQLEFVRPTFSMQRSQQDVRQRLEADRQQQQAPRLNILRSSSAAAAAASGQQISEESLQKSSQDSRGPTDQGLLEDMVRPGSGQGPPAPGM